MWYVYLALIRKTMVLYIWSIKAIYYEYELLTIGEVLINEVVDSKTSDLNSK